ncbi:MAG TPA: hypothetical protein VF230_01035 [Acidimicrobiales bacterium]
MGAARTTLVGSVRLVCFAATDSTWTLDAIVHGDRGLAEVGVPVSIEVERTETGWSRAAIEQLLEDWAREDPFVTVRVVRWPSHAVVRLDSAGVSVSSHLVRVD